MTFVITPPCRDLKDSGCIDVCPVDCIHPRYDAPEFQSVRQLYIDPSECIDCGACLPACPVNAIFEEDELPDRWHDSLEENRRWFEGPSAEAEPGRDSEGKREDSSFKTVDSSV